MFNQYELMGYLCLLACQCLEMKTGPCTFWASCLTECLTVITKNEFLFIKFTV